MFVSNRRRTRPETHIYDYAVEFEGELDGAGAARNEDFPLMLKPTAPLIASTKTKVRLTVNRLMLTFLTMLPIFIFNLSSQPLGVRFAYKPSPVASRRRYCPYS
jgi:hypothetical protein